MYVCMYVYIQCMSFHWDCLFRIVTGLQEEYRSSIPGRGKIFFFFFFFFCLSTDIQTVPGAHAVSYPMGSRG
jgi:hypothetical protein